MERRVVQKRKKTGKERSTF